MFTTLREIGVELTRYHGGSLTGKDIKKVMNNATYVFDQWAQILSAGKRHGCKLEQQDIVSKCKEYKSTFLLWDGAFSFARKVDPAAEDWPCFKGLWMQLWWAIVSWAAILLTKSI